MKIFKLNDLIKIRSAIFMYKANKNTLPKNLQLMFKDNTVNKNYNFRKKNRNIIKNMLELNRSRCVYQYLILNYGTPQKMRLREV